MQIKTHNQNEAVYYHNSSSPASNKEWCWKQNSLDWFWESLETKIERSY